MSRSPEQYSLALDSVVRRSQGTVRNVGLRHGLTESEIEDLVQEVRIRLWKARAETEALQELSASYVYRTTMSAALDMVRGARRGANQEALHEGIPGPSGLMPDQVLESKELAARLEGALQTLSDRRRPVVRMFLAGYGREEIASLLGWSEPKTRNLLYRGLADLRARLLDAESTDA